MRKLISAVLLAAAIGCGVFATEVVHGEQLNQTPAVGGSELEHVGVVDIERLVRQHPDAHKLDEIDKEITYLSSQLDSQGGVNEEAEKKAIAHLEAYKKLLVGEANAHADAVKASLNAKKAGVESQLKGEADNLGNQMEKYTNELKKEAGGDAPPPPSKSDVHGKQQQFDSKMRSYLNDLQLVAQRNMAARKIDIERRAQANLAGEKRKLDEQLAAKMEVVMRANQSQKLQLQLDMQTTQDEEQRKKLAEKLQALTSTEEDKRDAMRREMSVSFEAAKKAELARDEQELSSYQQKLRRDIDQQLGSEKGRVLHDVVGKTAPAAPPTNVKELQGRLEAKQRELKAQFEAHKNALVGGLQRDSAAAEADLKSQQKIIEDKLEAERKRILKDIMHQREVASKEDQKRQAHLKEQLDELKKQREHVYDAIVDQIRVDVKAVADEKHVPLVVDGYRVNVNCTDLTDLALQREGKK